MLDVVTWKWKGPANYRTKFSALHVNVLRSMVERHYPHPHRFTCITDDPVGLDPRIRVIPLWNDHKDLKNPSFRDGPSCYRRLKAFSAEAATIIGPRFVSLDIDCVIVDDMSPVWNRNEDFIIWGSAWPSFWYNGSMWMMTAGARRKVWDMFDPIRSPREAQAAGRKGSDQAWISHCLGHSEVTWGVDDGVYSFGVHLKRGHEKLPANARIVIFHGRLDPWSKESQAIRWVHENWR